MTKWIAANVCAALFSVVIVHGQEPNTVRTPAPAPTQAQVQAPAAAATITLSGCVANTAAAAVGATAAAPGAPAATMPRTDQFVLTVTPSPAAVGSPIGTSGATATVTAGRYSLIGNSGMSQYVGKRVEVSGTKVERGTGGAAAGTAVGTAGATATVPTGASVATEAHPSALTEVRVTSVRVLDETCR